MLGGDVMNARLTLAATVLATAAGCGGATTNAGIPGVPPPISATRLAGARLVDIRREPPLEWTFAESRFAVACPGGLPSDIVEPLLGRGADATRIEGAWRLDDANGEIVLTDIEGGGRRGADRVALPLRPAGAVRCDLGERQYNVFEGERRR
jgi:hypothetical protein